MARGLSARAIEEIVDAPKRRGRPPKIQTAFEAPKRRGRPPLARNVDEPPKRRGRPPLARADVEATPKRRGRPPRVGMEAEPPKRRGRPPLARELAPKRRGRPPVPRVDKDDKSVDMAFPLIGRNDLRRLIEETAILKNRASSSVGSCNELIKEYVQNKHLHAGAFRIVSRWAKLGNDDPQKLWLELAHLDDMREKAGIDRMAKAQGQLLPAIADEAQDAKEAGEAKEADDEAEAEPEDDKRNYPREVEEQAGAA
jgi:hypothetical protein